MLYNLLGISVGERKGNRVRSQSVGPARYSKDASSVTPSIRPISDISTPGFRTSFIPGRARLNGFYSGTDEITQFLRSLDVLGRLHDARTVMDSLP